MNILFYYKPIISDHKKVQNSLSSLYSFAKKKHLIFAICNAVNPACFSTLSRPGTLWSLMGCCEDWNYDLSAAQLCLQPVCCYICHNNCMQISFAWLCAMKQLLVGWDSITCLQSSFTNLPQTSCEAASWAKAWNMVIKMTSSVPMAWIKFQKQAGLN